MKSLKLLTAVTLAVALFGGTSWAQELGQNKDVPLSELSPFVSTSTDVAQGTSVIYAAAYPVLGDGVFPVFAHVGVGFSGVLELSYTNEGAIANLLGLTSPIDSWGAKLQIIPRREQFPSASLYIKGTIGWESQSIWSDDLQVRDPGLFVRGLYGTGYEFSTVAAGFSFESQMTEAITISLTAGIQEIRSRNLRIFIAPAPIIGNGYYDPGIHTSAILDGSASATYLVRPRLAVIAEVTPLPYFTVDIPANALSILRAYTGLVGIRYSITPMLNLDTYVRQQSKINDIAFTQFRLGISGLIRIPE